MADNTCGPSNAFKGLAHHVDQDRTRQQDRVVAGPHHAGQAFRSTPGDPAAANGEFAAFQGGNAPLPGFHVSDMHPPPGFLPHPRLQPVGPAPNAGGQWVNDFQRTLNLNDTSSPSVHRSPAGQNLRHPLGANYYVPSSLHQHMAPNMMGPTGVLSYNNGFLHGHMPTGTFNAQHHQGEVDMIDPLIQQQIDTEFDLAMDTWMRENGQMTMDDTPVGVAGSAPAAQSTRPESQTIHSDVNIEAEAALAERDAQVLQQAAGAGMQSVGAVEPTLAHQLQPEQEASTRTQPTETQPQVDTELARAAQQLVDSVSDNDSEKFKNSSFLQMMRRIAAEEVTVRGNELVETTRVANAEFGSGSHVTSRTSAAPSPTTAPPQHSESPGTQDATLFTGETRYHSI
ncbi:hypothetical protein F5X99DRAFT_383108 [Biscogniauxia marginata]|nr:hypothetical protein F5X99DRAFT_383108 [Biscogniauxia marginata]